MESFPASGALGFSGFSPSPGGSKEHPRAPARTAAQQTLPRPHRERRDGNEKCELTAGWCAPVWVIHGLMRDFWDNGFFSMENYLPRAAGIQNGDHGVVAFTWFALHLHKTSQRVTNRNKFPLFTELGLWYCKQQVKILKRMCGFSTLCDPLEAERGCCSKFDVKTGELSFKSFQSDKIRNRLSAVDWHCLLENGL